MLCIEKIFFIIYFVGSGVGARYRVRVRDGGGFSAAYMGRRGNGTERHGRGETGHARRRGINALGRRGSADRLGCVPKPRKPPEGQISGL